MSLINQVLNDLEQRGANHTPPNTAIRPVLRSQERHRILMPAMLLVVLLSGLAAWEWYANRPSQATSASVSVADTLQTTTGELDKPAQPISSQSTAKPGNAPPVGIHSGTGMTGLVLSYELSKHIPGSAATQTLTAPGSAPELEQSSMTRLEHKPATLTAEALTTVVPTKVTPAAKAPVVSPAPLISGVQPSPVPAINKPTSFLITGENFMPGARVTLHSPKRNYPDLHLNSVNATQITLTPNFGDVQQVWSVEVTNPDHQVSGPFNFMVQAVPNAKESQTAIVKGTAQEVPSSPQGRIHKQVIPASAEQQAENEFRKANDLVQQGNIEDALAGFATALKLDAHHTGARQAMTGLLLDAKRYDEAEQLLKQGLALNPENSSFAMILARLQVDRNALAQALQTLRTTLPYATQQADYLAFVAAVSQRLGQHAEAVDYYRKALKIAPGSAIWLMGMGISLQEDYHPEEARLAFQQALDSHTLNKELQNFVAGRLRALSADK